MDSNEARYGVGKCTCNGASSDYEVIDIAAGKWLYKHYRTFAGALAKVEKLADGQTSASDRWYAK